MPDFIFPHWITGPVIGLFIGSFAGVVGERLPVGGAWAYARSRCPHCDHRLGILDLIPIISWLASGRRCRHCNESISWFYPMIEIAGAIIALSAALVFDGGMFWLSCGLGWVLLMLAASDWRHMVLPDLLTLPLIVAGLAATYLIDPAKIAGHAAGALIGFATFAAIAALYRRFRGRDGLGLGDAKLLAAGGAWLGWAGLPSVVIWAGLTGLAWALVHSIASRQKLAADLALPFGAFLALGIWLVWLSGPMIIVIQF